MNKRTTKFRAWNGKYMQTDDFYVDSDGDIRILKDGGGWSGYEYLSWESDWILMQFTGLKDSTGKEIYEGDNVQVSDTLTNETFSGYVSFIDASFVIKSEYITHYRWQDYDCQVVGNIFEDGK